MQVDLTTSPGIVWRPDAAMVEQANLEAVEALKRQDVSTARRIFNNDMLINEKRYAIENAILILMATQQPMARDLRLMAAFLEVITELERMGDYAKGNAKVTQRIGDAPLYFNMRKFSTMVDLAVNMLHRALGARSRGPGLPPRSRVARRANAAAQ